MAVPPKFVGQKLLLAAHPNKALNTVELYLDYVCPFSAKMFKTLNKSVLPEARKAPYAPNVEFVFRQQIQPWHPSSTLVHEAGAAVLKLDEGKFWEFSQKLFEQQNDFFDVNVVNEPRNKTYERLAAVGSSVGVDEKKMYNLLKVPDKPGEGGSLNVGNQVTDDVKVMVKMNRLTGVHVTPTVLLNGVVDNSISSSFTAEQWLDWLKKNCS